MSKSLFTALFSVVTAFLPGCTGPTLNNSQSLAIDANSATIKYVRMSGAFGMSKSGPSFYVADAGVGITYDKHIILGRLYERATLPLVSVSPDGNFAEVLNVYEPFKHGVGILWYEKENPGAIKLLETNGSRMHRLRLPGVIVPSYVHPTPVQYVGRAGTIGEMVWQRPPGYMDLIVLAPFLDMEGFNGMAQAAKTIKVEAGKTYIVEHYYKEGDKQGDHIFKVEVENGKASLVPQGYGGKLRTTGYLDGRFVIRAE